MTVSLWGFNMDIQSLFKDKTCLTTALTLSHHGKSAPYERLEFLGDRVLGLVIAEYLYRKFPKEKEGELARRHTALVREETLAEIAIDMGIPSLIKTKEDELRSNPSILSDVCEAVLGALYLDQGIQKVKEFMLPFWMPYVEANKEAPKDAKSALQEWAQKHAFDLPVYSVLKRAGTDHEPYFFMQVEIMGAGLAHGEGKSKKIAEQNAADNLLKQLEK